MCIYIYTVYIIYTHILMDFRRADWCLGAIGWREYVFKSVCSIWMHCDLFLYVCVHSLGVPTQGSCRFTTSFQKESLHQQILHKERIRRIRRTTIYDEFTQKMHCKSHRTRSPYEGWSLVGIRFHIRSGGWTLHKVWEDTAHVGPNIMVGRTVRAWEASFSF